MPVLKNPRYERFAQGVAKGKSQHDAYIYAGYAPNQKPKDVRSNAGTLARRPEIAERIIELQEKQAKRVGITVDALLGELDEMFKLAKRVKHPAAGVGAVLAKGKLLGLIVDKAEVEGTIRKPARRPTTDRQMTMEEWQKKFAPEGVLPPKGTVQ
jgi:phage terminase small subunit